MTYVLIWSMTEHYIQNFESYKEATTTLAYLHSIVCVIRRGIKSVSKIEIKRLA